MRAIAFALAVLAAGSTALGAPQEVKQQPAEIFAGHDCCGRLAHTVIKQVGEIRSDERTFTIYSLWFVNPQSRHGMKRLAVTEGALFRGSYIISSWATPVLEAGLVKFTCEDGAACVGDDFAIVDGKLPSRLWVDGEVNQLEETI